MWRHESLLAFGNETPDEKVDKRDQDDDEQNGQQVAYHFHHVRSFPIEAEEVLEETPIGDAPNRARPPEPIRVPSGVGQVNVGGQWHVHILRDVLLSARLAARSGPEWGIQSVIDVKYGQSVLVRLLTLSWPSLPVRQSGGHFPQTVGGFVRVVTTVVVMVTGQIRSNTSAIRTTVLAVRVTACDEIQFWPGRNQEER